MEPHILAIIFAVSNTDCGSVWNMDFVSALDSSQASMELLFGSGDVPGSKKEIM